MGHVRKALLSFAFISVLALAPVGIAADEAASINVSAARSKISIDNFGQVNPTYYRGAQPDDRDYNDLAALGVKTVIDLQRDGVAAEEQLVKSAGMKFHRIAMTTRDRTHG